MRHYSEDTIELYLLGAPDVQPIRAEIGEHLTGCAGCREIHAELSALYGEAGAVRAESGRKAAEALVVRAVGLETPPWSPAAEPARLPLRARAALFVIRRPVASAVSFLGVAALLALGLSFLRLPADPRPAHLRAENGALVVLDREGRELWRRYLGPSLTDDRLRDDMRPVAVLRDVDGEPGAEVIIAGRDFPDWPGRNVVVCLRPDGREKWRYPINRTMGFGSETFGDSYLVHAVWCEDFDGDGEAEVVALASSTQYYPCVVLTLRGATGAFRTEYWHAGLLAAGLPFDATGGPGRELLLAGENNGFNRAVAVLLDPTRMSGHSPAPPAYTPRDVAPGNERGYIMFPQSDLNRLSPVRPGGKNLLAEGPASLIVITREWDHESPLELLYHLDSSLRCWKVVPSDLHLAEHRHLQAEGKLSRQPDAAYVEDLRRGVRYWNGREFVTWEEWRGTTAHK